MPTFQYEARDGSGNQIKDIIDAPSEDEAHATIRQMGYYVTKIAVKKSRKGAARTTSQKRKSFAIGGVKFKKLVEFTRQLAILQDAGLPILRSLQILENQCTPGRLKNSLIDVCDDIQNGATLSEAMGKQPKAFNRLYVNMIKAGEAGGALEVILMRLAEFLEKSQTLKRKVKGALVYPIVVVLVAVGILSFIMIKIVPEFRKIFKEFGMKSLPAPTEILIATSNYMVKYWFLIPGIPFGIWLMVLLICKFRYGRTGWDLFKLKMPIFGNLVEKNIVARTMRTLGTLVTSGVPILEALNITRETSGNLVFEHMFAKVYDAIREGETISRPMKEHARPRLNALYFFFWFFFVGGIGILFGVLKMRLAIVSDLVVNMVDVGEETGELDTMLYKVADNYDEEVKILTESLVSLLEPLLVCFLGGAVGFIVIALFLPLIELISTLSK